MAPGDEARIAWRHDTYSFQLELLPPPQMERGEQEGGGYGQPTGVPLKVTTCHLHRPGGWLPCVTSFHCCLARHRRHTLLTRLPPPSPKPPHIAHQDEAWLASYERWSSYNTELVSAAAQDPLRYRSLAVAAASLAARPHDHGVDAEQAAALCAKLM